MMQQPQTTLRTYWAAKEGSQLGAELYNRVVQYYDYLRRSGRLELWRRSYNAYYRGGIEGGMLGKAGKQNELVKLWINDFRNLIQHLLIMTTQQPPSFDGRATNTDVKSQDQTILASGLLEYYLREKRLERYVIQAVEQSLIYAEGFVMDGWNQALGEPFGVNPADGSLVHEGDLEYQSYGPIDLVRDFTKSDPLRHQWWIIRVPENRWDLAAEYPEQAAAIYAQPDRFQNALEQPWMGEESVMRSSYQTDDIWTYRFFHAKTPALPNGAYAKFCQDGIVLENGPLQYEELPVYRVAPSEQFGTGFGYTNTFDLLPVQQAQDGVFSAVASNQNAFGVQNICVPKGHDISVQQLAGGLNVIYYDPKLGKPEPLNLLGTTQESFTFIEVLEKAGERLSGVNSVARGNPESSLKSGAALALVQSMALQFNSGLQRSYKQLLEDVGSGTIKKLQKFAKTKRVATIAGIAKRAMLKEFTGDDLANVSRVTVDIGNAVSRTAAGRVQIGQDLLQGGLIKTADEYIQVLSTGQLDPLIEGPQKELLYIRSENEALSDGRPAQVLAIDNHVTHVQEHMSVLASPEARTDPNIVQTTLAHIQDHIQQWRTVDPAILQLRGIAAPPPPPMMPMGPPGMTPPPGPGVPTATQPPAPGGPPNVAGVMGQAHPEMPMMPNMPTNPLTGERAMVPGVNA